jgi:hypothetical protein
MYYNLFISSLRRFFAGQVGNLRPIGNRPAGSAYNAPANARTVCGLPLM